MNMVLWILFGAITAWLAVIFIGGSTPRRTAQYVAAGIVGAVASGFAMQRLIGHSQYEINFYSLLVSVGGSLCSVALLTYISLQAHNRP